jgi:hypothetical protein
MGTLLATVPVAPVASTNAKPRATLSVPSVAMNGTMCARVTNNPFTAPIATPAINPAATATHGFRPLYVISRAANTAPTARTDPTERSKPPAISTMVMPVAMIPIVLMPCSTLKMLRRVKKYGLAIDSPTQSTKRASSTPASRAAKSRRIRPAPDFPVASKDVAFAAAPLGGVTWVRTATASRPPSRR